MPWHDRVRVEDGPFAGPASIDAANDRLLATMVQDMVSFGAKASGEGVARRDSNEYGRFDFFA